MSGTKWTTDQHDAIYTARAEDGAGCNILVNAAAGSGKTAVLVERIIQKLIPNVYDPTTTDVDRLLVVTFTNAAAAEMQKRVSDALMREMAKADPALAELLKRQISLVSHADITTIDAFCLKVVRNYFHLLNIDPNFTIASEAELSLMKDEAAEELFDELYTARDEEFIGLMCQYSDGRDDTGLANLVFRIHGFMQSMPDPAGWLLEKSRMYKMEDGPEACLWIDAARQEKDRLIQRICSTLLSMLSAMAQACELDLPDKAALLSYLKENPPGAGGEVDSAWKTYYQAAYADYFQFAAVAGMEWDEVYDALQKLDFPRINARGIAFRAEAEEIKAQFGVVRKNLTESLKKTISAPLAETAAFLREKVYPTAEQLVRLVLRFDEKYQEKKDKKNILEFSDIEHLCLRLFSEQPDVAAVFREQYVEILMDEYQDSNALQEAIFSAISRGDNFFMVGDMKQSIYRFRSGDPTIFKGKNDTYSKTPGQKNRKIILSKNFRSRLEVLNGVNAVFTRLMSEEAGEMEYDQDQQLHLGDETYAPVNMDYRPVCAAIEGHTRHGGDEEELEDIRIEARYIARKIRELKDSGFKIRDVQTISEPDSESGGFRTVKKTIYRNIQNKDVTILMSSYKSAASIYVEELGAFGIPCFAETGGYFERNEIKIMLSLIKIIHNPYQDIPLLSVLRSPIGNFTDSQLAQVRNFAEGRFYTALKACAVSESDPAAQCAAFVEKLARWREYSKYMSSDKLLWTLYAETEFYTFVGALEGGEDAQANLRLLFQRAKQFESSGYKGLFNFARYISRIRKKEEDLSTAGMIGEKHDVVRLMTIHKSKGLEFPVVFLAGTGKRFYNRDDQGSVLLHKELGLGMDYINFEESYKMPTAAKTAVAAAIRRESISEEIRKLYVAMTRAKEKLFVTGVVAGRDASDADKYAKSGLSREEEKWNAALPGKDAVFDPPEVLESRRYIDWVAPVARMAEEWIYEAVSCDEAVSGVYVVPEEEEQNQSAEFAGIEAALDFVYPYFIPQDMPVKISVTELERCRLGNDTPEPELRAIPDFLAEEQPLTAAAAGTALHTAMQKIPPVQDMDAGYVNEWITRLIDNGDLTPEEARCIHVEKILQFYNTDLGTRLLRSKRIWREQPFEIIVPAEEAGFPGTGETVILQGIIDCFFEEEDGLVLVDYKTDQYQNKADILAKYTTQLDYYAKALVQIMKSPVKNKYLYLFYQGDVVECKT